MHFLKKYQLYFAASKRGAIALRNSFSKKAVSLFVLGIILFSSLGIFFESAPFPASGSVIHSLGGAQLLPPNQLVLVNQGTASQGNGGSSGNATVKQVTLITGDTASVYFNLKDTKKISGIMFKPSNPDTKFTSFSRGNETYLFPQGVDTNRFNPQLFDLNILLQDNFTDHIPIIIQSTAGIDFDQFLPSLSSQSFASTKESNIRTMQIGHLSFVALVSKQPYAAALYDKLSASHSISHVYLDSLVKEFSSNSVPDPGDNGGLAIINAVKAWTQFGVNGSGMKIAIIDTGIDANSSDFNFPNGTSKIIYSINLTDDNSTSDYFGHGTHVTGIASGTGLSSNGTFMGVAPNAQILNIKVLDQYGYGQESWVMEGIQQAVAHNASVISMSLGGPPDPALDSVVNWASSQGVLVVVAAGNSGSHYWTIGSPAEASGAITVGADAEPNWQNAPSSESMMNFSSLGPENTNLTIKPDVVAPGWNIISDRAPNSLLARVLPPYPGFDENYMMLSGTSMATPFVSGTAALIKERHPSWSVPMIMSAIESTATIINETWDGVPYVSPYVEGDGRINVLAAVNPSLLFSPAILNIGDVYNLSNSSTILTIYNPTNSMLNASLSYDITNVNDGSNATRYVTLNESYVSVAAGSTDEVEISVSNQVPSSVYGGYIYAFNQSNPVQLLAHAAVGFYAMHYLTATFVGPYGPISGLPIFYSLYNSTWLESNYATGYPFLATNENGQFMAPVFNGMNVLATTLYYQNQFPMFINSVTNISSSNQSITLGGIDNMLTVDFNPNSANASFKDLFDIFSTYTVPNNIGSPHATPLSSDQVFFGSFNQSPNGTTIYVSPNVLNEYLGAAYQYSLGPDITDLHSLKYEMYNLTNSITNTLNEDQLSRVQTSYLDTINSLPVTDGISIASPFFPPIAGELHGKDFEFFTSIFPLAIPNQVTHFLTPNTNYTELAFLGSMLSFEDFNSGSAGSIKLDEFNAHPYYRNMIVEGEQGTTTGKTNVLLLGSNIFSEAYGQIHTILDSQANCTSYAYVNGSLANSVSTGGDSCYSFYGVNNISARSQIQFVSTVAYSRPLSSLVLENRTVYADSATGSLSGWFAGIDIRNVTLDGLGLFNEVPPGSINATFTTGFGTDYTPSVNSVSLQYSTDGGKSWVPVESIIPLSSTKYSDHNTTLYRTEFGNIDSRHFVSIRVVVGDDSDGITTLEIINAFYVGLPYQINFDEAGLQSHTQWGVTFNGTTVYSTNPSISFNQFNGTYQYNTSSLITLDNDSRYLTNQTSGIIDVNGGNVNQSIEFSAQFFITVASNPSAAGSVSPSSGWFNKSQMIIINASAQGGFRFSNWNASQGIQVGNPLLAQTSATIYGPGYLIANFGSLVFSSNVTFIETGLAQSAVWSLIFNGENYSSNSPSITIENVAPGTYGWIVSSPINVGNGTRFVATRTNSSIAVPEGANTLSVKIAFSEQFQIIFMVSPAGAGSIGPSPPNSTGNNEFWYNSGSGVNVNAIPNNGFEFSTWQTSSPAIGVVNKHEEITATGKIVDEATARINGSGTLAAVFEILGNSTTTTTTTTTTTSSSSTQTGGGQWITGLSLAGAVVAVVAVATFVLIQRRRKVP